MQLNFSFTWTFLDKFMLIVAVAAISELLFLIFKTNWGFDITTSLIVLVWLFCTCVSYLPFEVLDLAECANSHRTPYMTKYRRMLLSTIYLAFWPFMLPLTLVVVAFSAAIILKYENKKKSGSFTGTIPLTNAVPAATEHDAFQRFRDKYAGALDPDASISAEEYTEIYKRALNDLNMLN